MSADLKNNPVSPQHSDFDFESEAQERANESGIFKRWLRYADQALAEDHKDDSEKAA